MMRDGGGHGWLLDEMACIGRENLDPHHVARYDDKEDADAAAEVALLRSAGAAPASTVVDLGAGTGQFALAAAEVWARVVAVDPSPVMLDRLRQAARVRSSPLEIVQAGFLTYEHDGEPPDVVYSRYALHHLPDFWKAVALARIRRALRPGGILRLWDVVYHFPLDEAADRIERWCATAATAGADDGEWTRADLEEHVRDEGSTFTWLLEPMIRRAGFEIGDVRYGDDGFSARYLLVATPTAARRDN
ncbi:MAG TPA: class I SAM-dependent methyltransferase [Acidimicrobiales bacterium]|nr:class I SAM-dependent methyltransferase [Acidimicrobiales bacterium]